MSEIGLAVLAGIALWSLLRPGGPPRRVRRRMDRLAGEGRPGPHPHPGPTGPGAGRVLASLAAGVGRRVPGGRGDLGPLLAAAGSDGVDADTIVGSAVVSSVAGALTGLLLGPLLLVASPLLAWAGYRLPRTLLRARLRNRREAVSAALPDAADLLVLAVRAGLNIPLALRRTAGHVVGPLGEELRRAVRDVDLGAPLAEALAGLSLRCGGGEVEALASVLLGSERFGAPVASSLEAFARDLAARRRTAAEERARRAPVRMLVPLVFLILPAFILMTVVPLFLGAFRSLGL